MGLFDKKICAICGKETGRIAFTFKEDKKCLCKECVEKLPDDEFREYAKKYWTADYFKNTYLPFLEENEERRKNFKLKAWYGALFIDQQNKMFCYSKDMAFDKTTEIPKYTPIIKFDDISKESAVYFDAYDTKEGLLGNVTHHGSVKLLLDCCYPKFYFEGTIKMDLTIKGKRNDPFQNLPEDLEKVRDLFCILLGVEDRIPPDRRK